MGWVAVGGGFLIGPLVGALATKVVVNAAKPKDITNELLIGSAVQAAAAVGAYMLADKVREPNLHDFAYGATWGNGIGAGIVGVAGLYGKTSPEAKASLGKYFPTDASTRSQALASGEPSGYTLRPTGLLGVLTAASKHGYR